MDGRKGQKSSLVNCPELVCVLGKTVYGTGWRELRDLTDVPCPQIVLPPHLERIREKLAENIHELWALTRIEQGWTYGPVSGQGREAKLAMEK